MEINVSFPTENAWKYFTTNPPCKETIKYSANEARLINVDQLDKALQHGALLLSLSHHTQFGQLIRTAEFFRAKNLLKVPRDRFLQEFLKVCQALKKMRQLDMPTLFSTLAAQVKREPDGVLEAPCRSYFAFLLIRCQVQAALLYRIANCSLNTFRLGKPWMERGHLLESVIPTMGTTCSLWYHANIMLYYLDRIYGQLREFLGFLRDPPYLDQPLPPIPESLLNWLEGRFGEVANPTKSKALSKIFAQDAGPVLATKYLVGEEDFGEAISRNLADSGQEEEPPVSLVDSTLEVCLPLPSKKRKMAEFTPTFEDSFLKEISADDPQASPYLQPFRKKGSKKKDKLQKENSLKKKISTDDYSQASPCLQPGKKGSKKKERLQKENPPKKKSTKQGQKEEDSDTPLKKKSKVEPVVAAVPSQTMDVSAATSSQPEFVSAMVWPFVKDLVRKSDANKLPMKTVFIKVLKKFPHFKAAEQKVVEIVKQTIREVVVSARKENKS